MPSIHTLSRRVGAERSALALAGLLGVISLATLVAWWLRFDDVLQPFGLQTPLGPNAAAGFFFLSFALLADAASWKHSALLAAVAILLATLSLAQDASGLDLQIDQLLSTYRPSTAGASPGRMPEVTALAFILGGGTLFWRSAGGGLLRRLLAEALLGSLIASAGLAATLGHSADLPQVHTWGAARTIGPIEALALLLLGLSLLLRAWRERTAIGGDAPPWAPLPILVGCSTLSLVLWVGLRAHENATVAQLTSAQFTQFVAQCEDSLEKQVAQFERLARLWGDGPNRATAAWEADATRQMRDSSGALGCLAIAVVDSSQHTVWTHPAEGPFPRIGFQHGDLEARQLAMRRAQDGNGRPVISGTTLVTASERGFVIYAPITRSGFPAGFVAAEFSYRDFFGHIATSKSPLLDHYHGSVRIDDQLVFRHTPTTLPRDEFATERLVDLEGRRLQLRLAPSSSLLTRGRHYLPEIALSAGLGITTLLGLSVHFARGARAGQRAAELSNRRLFAENEERRRIEDRLKVSDERLRLALDSTQIGIFEWNVASGHVYYSPALWGMFGYNHPLMPTTVEAWQSLIHPEDILLYRRRVEAQRNGIASFIDPEYRVRTRDGAWRWVYTRSKAVATDPNGRPTRIVGTVQDVTDRRTSELALRRSQAEARKLSLVAARTENPVLITSDDGRIEWANEAFCRMMEYDLPEVVGKEPIHFLLGPDSDQTALTALRSAFERGEAIGVEAGSYAKSGRKYHMHIEVQPVRGADGSLENFIAVLTDITSRVATERQLRRAKTEADDASRAKSEFLASMSHEIRTPMNGVIGMTSLLMETRLNAEQRDFVNTIRTSGEALLTIINDILDFSKIESGKMELERAPFALAHCIEDALDLFAAQTSAKKVELGYHAAPDVPSWIVGDVTRLRQVLVNLINNAVKFTPGGSISVLVRRLPSSSDVLLEFAVRDTGIGIPPERMDRLFKAFSQVDSSTTRKYGGTGLGLAISQRLCELMGGSIRAESSVGQGSSFIFTIRAQAAPSPANTEIPAIPTALQQGPALCIEDNPVTAARIHALFEKWGADCVLAPDLPTALDRAAHLQTPPSVLVADAGQFDSPSEMERLSTLRCPRLFLHPFSQSASTAPPEDQPFASATKPIRTGAFFQAVVDLFRTTVRGSTSTPPMAPRLLGEEIPLEVLLAEDNPVNQKVALRFFERLGYRADAVGNGLEAITTLEYRCYDVVFMDLQMPEMDGLEATRQIRARIPASRQPKIVALTANAMPGDREQCFAAGMNDYISKPVKLQELNDVIRRLFGHHSTPAPNSDSPSA